MRAWCFAKRSDEGGARRAAPLCVTALVLLAAGCGTPGAKFGVVEATAQPDADGVQAVEIEVHSYYFKPNRIVVQAGRPVELTLKFKNLITPHNLTCEHPDAGISVDKSAGIFSFRRTKHARFTPEKPGEYQFHCGVGSHMMKGMTGTLVVR